MTTSTQRAEALRAAQAPVKQTYRDDPSAALVPMRATGTLGVEGISCSVSTGQALVEAGLHEAAAGSGLQACSGDMLLQALVACAGVTISAVATSMELDVRGGTVTAEALLDIRGTLGLDREAPVGFTDIAVTVELDTDEPPERVAKLLELSERYCVVGQTIARGAAVRFASPD